jgi:hypothetical protein
MSDRLLLGTRKGLFLVERNAQGWHISRDMLLGDPVTMVLADRQGHWHAAVEHGHYGVKLKRSVDQGESWEERSVPAYPPKPDDEIDMDPVGQQPLPWNLMRIWALESGAPDKPGDLWCGSIPGGLFRSRDGGDSWQLVESLWQHPDRKNWAGGGADYPGIHSIMLDPRDPRIIRIGVSCGGVWASFDDGENWGCYGEGLRAEYMPPDQAYDQKVQDPHRMVQCRVSPDHLWIQHHNGIFRSSDGGAHWQEIETAQPSAFGFAVAVHPQDPDRAWFVPGVRDDARYPVNGRLLVTRTRDGGKSFEPLANGLPQQHAYDLVYRHGLDIDDSGDRLAFGSTTGNAWVSDDQGEHWQSISHFLPPVYCVRFV